MIAFREGWLVVFATHSANFMRNVFLPKGKRATLRSKVKRDPIYTPCNAVGSPEFNQPTVHQEEEEEQGYAISWERLMNIAYLFTPSVIVTRKLPRLPPFPFSSILNRHHHHPNGSFLIADFFLIIRIKLLLHIILFLGYMTQVKFNSNQLICRLSTVINFGLMFENDARKNKRIRVDESRESNDFKPEASMRISFNFFFFAFSSTSWGTGAHALLFCVEWTTGLPQSFDHFSSSIVLEPIRTSGARRPQCLTTMTWPDQPPFSASFWAGVINPLSFSSRGSKWWRRMRPTYSKRYALWRALQLPGRAACPSMGLTTPKSVPNFWMKKVQDVDHFKKSIRYSTPMIIRIPFNFIWKIPESELYPSSWDC